MRDVSACVLWALVEADARNRAGNGALELNAELDGVGIVPCHDGGCIARAEHAPSLSRGVCWSWGRRWRRRGAYTRS